MYDSASIKALQNRISRHEYRTQIINVLKKIKTRHPIHLLSVVEFSTQNKQLSI